MKQKFACVVAESNPSEPSVTGSDGPDNFTFASYLDALNTKAARVAIDLELINDYVKKFGVDQIAQFKNICVFIYRLYNLNGLGDLFVSSVDFLTEIFGLQYMIDFGKKIFDYLSGIFVTLYNKLLLAPPVAESRAIDALRFIRMSMSTVFNSDIVTAVRNFVLSLVSFGLFSKPTNESITQALGPAKSASSIELVDTILESCISFVTFSEQVSSGAPIADIFSHRDPVSTFISRSHELDTMKDLTYSGLPVEGKICRREFLSEVCKCVDAGATLATNLPVNAPQKRSVDIALKRMRLIKATFLNMMNAERRPMPFCVCIEGVPGIGKGLLIDYVGMTWSHVKDRTYEPSHVYHRQATEEYWSGYEPASKPIIHYSEPGALATKIAGTRGDPVMTEFLSVCDNQPYMCNMADVESKGKVYAQPELIVMDCNDPSMNLNVIVNNPSAVRRRILYVRPTVKREFTKSDGRRIDQQKSLNSSTPKLDRWTFTVYRQIPVNNKISEEEIVLSNVDIYSLTTFLKKEFTTHIAEQEGSVDLIQDVNISDYTVATESRTLDQNVVLVVIHLLGYDYRWVTEPIVSFMRVIYNLAIMGLWSVLGCTMWFTPSSMYKQLAKYLWSKKFETARREFEFSWEYFKGSMGITNRLTGGARLSYKTRSAIALFSSLLLLWKLGFFAKSLFAEGNVVSASKKWSEEEVTSKLDSIMEECRATRPDPRPRRGNGIDWESLNRPQPVPIYDHAKYNEPEKIRTAVSHNIRLVRFAGQKTIETHILGVFQDIAIVNRHSVAVDKDGKWDVEVRNVSDQITSLHKVVVDRNEMFQADGDIWVIRLRGLKFKDIRKYIAADFVTPPVYGSVGLIDNEKVLIKDSPSIVANDPNWGAVPVEKPLVYKWSAHDRGKCGLPLFMEYSGGYGVVGIHIAGTNTIESFSQKISLPSLMEAIKFLSNHSCTLGVNSEGRVKLPVGMEISLTVNGRSPLCYEDVRGLEVFGSLKGYTAMKLGKSNLEKSPFLKHAEKLTGISPYDEVGNPLFGAPPFSHGYNKETGEYQAPYNHFVKKCGVVKNSLHPAILRKSIEVVTQHITDGFTTKGVADLRPVPLAVAINGDPQDFYSRPIKASTSGGWVWPGAKKKYMRDCCLPWKEEARETLFDINEQVLELLLAYERGEDALPLLGAQLKDEPRAWSKILDRKTRVFCMSPFEATLVNKMFLSPFYTKMVEYDDLFCAAIGINMHSSDVGDLVYKMTSFSDKFMEGDYGGYDTSMPYDIGLAANTVVYNVLKTFGYTEKELNFVRGILSDNMYPTIVMRGDVFAAPALQPSGKYATAEDNSLRGLILLVYAWIEECTKFGDMYSDRTRTTQFTPEEFFTYVRPVVYGDDMLAGVKPKAQKYFNNINYQLFCKEVYGLDFTNAQKTLEMSAFLEWKDTSFLKRSFVYREDIRQWVAPLELSSIMKAISYYLPSRSVSSRDQLIDSCVSAARELFFHLPADEYDRRRWLFAETIAEIYDLSSHDVIKLFPTFEEIRTSCFGEEFLL